jgi:hypothetical protein
MGLAAVYRGRVDFDLPALVAELVESQSVPFLPFLRYKESGLRKRAQWEETWRLQRREDAIDAEVESEQRVRPDLDPKADPKSDRVTAEAGALPS